VLFSSTGRFLRVLCCRARIFHGVAAIVKEAPYYPILDHFDAAMSLSDSENGSLLILLLCPNPGNVMLLLRSGDMDNLAAWGFTAVRLMMAWPGVFPSPNTVTHKLVRCKGL
jgi:hypothetical protein